jgi:hypothetical protein
MGSEYSATYYMYWNGDKVLILQDLPAALLCLRHIGTYFGICFFSS